MRCFIAVALASCVACASPSPTQPTPPTATGPVATQRITFSGIVTDSETYAPLAGASVCWSGTSEPNCASTASDGSYRFMADPLAGIPPGAVNVRLCPSASGEARESRQACVPLSGNVVSWSTTLQRRITVEAGQRVRSTIFGGEGNGSVEEPCEPCKLVHVTVPRSGSLVVRLTPDTADAGLQLVVPYARLQADGSLPITNERDIIVWVKGSASLPASFELSTTFTPGS